MQQTVEAMLIVGRSLHQLHKEALSDRSRVASANGKGATALRIEINPDMAARHPATC